MANPKRENEKFLKQLWSAPEIAIEQLNLVYTNDDNRKGFKYEPWHFTYAPLSTSYLKAYRTLDLEVVLKQNEVLGNSNFSSEFIEKYLSENILDINTKLL